MRRRLSSWFSLVLSLLLAAVQLSGGDGGTWEVVRESIGISAMHMQLLHNDRVVIFDRTDFGLSNISLPGGNCRRDGNDTAAPVDCSAHSVEYAVPTNSIRALMIMTDTWCSSGSVAADGRLIQTGGFNDGERRARVFTPCDGCDWEEKPAALTMRRWYASNQNLPDGRAIIVGGRRQFNYEFYPKASARDAAAFSLPFLRETKTAAEDNLYPFLHLSVDGNLFVFANNRAILLDYRRNVIVRKYPAIPGGDPRSYPSSGSSVMLPLKAAGDAEVLVCGGAPAGSYTRATISIFLPALDTCGRIKITDSSPTWMMERMPMGRVMGDMLLLPDESVLIINGARRGTAGWELAQAPATAPVVYMPENPAGSRFEILNPSRIPRLYHSSAILLRDGRVLVGGSNPHVTYQFYGAQYPTELSLEAFSPSYLNSSNSLSRPTITTAASPLKLAYGQNVKIQFRLIKQLNKAGVSVTMAAPSFATHSFSMNQRLLVLRVSQPVRLSRSTYEVQITFPSSPNTAPPGYYLLFVVHERIPSHGIWIHIH